MGACAPSLSLSLSLSFSVSMYVCVRVCVRLALCVYVHVCVPAISLRRSVRTGEDYPPETAYVLQSASPLIQLIMSTGLPSQVPYKPSARLTPVRTGSAAGVRNRFSHLS